MEEGAGGEEEEEESGSMIFLCTTQSGGFSPLGFREIRLMQVSRYRDLASFGFVCNLSPYTSELR